MNNDISLIEIIGAQQVEIYALRSRMAQLEAMLQPVEASTPASTPPQE